MNFLNKLLVKGTKLIATISMMASSIALINFLVNIIRDSIVNNPTTITNASAVSYSLFGISMFFCGMFYMIMVTVENNKELAQKGVSYTLLGNLFINLIIPSFFPENYLKAIVHYAPFLLANIGILCALMMIFLSIKFFVKFDAWCEARQTRFKNYLNQRSLKKAKMKEELKNQREMEKLEKSQTNTVITPIINLSFFDTIGTIFTQENHQDFLQKMNNLKETLGTFNQESHDVEVDTEIKLLVEKNLPKMTQLYLEAKEENEKQDVLNMLEKVNTYFKYFKHEMDNKQSFKVSLNKESELKYMSQKYSI